MGKLLLGKSGPHFRIGEDYAEIYSAIMSLFGEDKNEIKLVLLREFEPNISKDRTLREAIRPLWN